MDLLVLQPYLIKADERGIQKGTFDLDLRSDVRNNQLNAPGRATISDMEFVAAEVGRPFMGLPRQAVLAFLMRNENKITVDFVGGRHQQSPISLNQTFTSRLAFAMARSSG